MKIVIDIDENLYARLFDHGGDNHNDAVDMTKAIRKGTPLNEVLAGIDRRVDIALDAIKAVVAESEAEHG